MSDFAWMAVVAIAFFAGALIRGSKIASAEVRASQKSFRDIVSMMASLLNAYEQSKALNAGLVDLVIRSSRSAISMSKAIRNGEPVIDEDLLNFEMANEQQLNIGSKIKELGSKIPPESSEKLREALEAYLRDTGDREL